MKLATLLFAVALSSGVRALVGSGQEVLTSFDQRSHKGVLDDGTAHGQDVFTDQDATEGYAVDMLSALAVMQSSYFQLWLGTWSAAIDWTAAVINTHVITGLLTLTRRYDNKHLSRQPDKPVEDRETSPRLVFEEATINKYFMHTTAYYFGENAFAIRNQAYDDMLWVVLGWLESIRFSKEQSGVQSAAGSGWYGQDYEGAFAHRARIFYDLASRGWDTSLCDGGMVWNPRLTPYKNAITNQLFIAASINMYLHFPGDPNHAPYLTGHDSSPDADGLSASIHYRADDRKYLNNAVKAYDWLQSSNMTNAHGLYVDGYHITNYTRHSNGTRRCDDRNEMVYTYNQGVILTGMRGLFDATGSTSYLQDGYNLLHAVISSTGFSSAPGKPHEYQWSGLGRGGVLEDYCDASGQCNQDGQAFKGIYFLHLARFCEELPRKLEAAGGRVIEPEARERHAEECRKAASWVRWNARAALKTRKEGKFGMWWNAHLVEEGRVDVSMVDVELPRGAEDYRNRPELLSLWETGASGQDPRKDDYMGSGSAKDSNDRGRGRTVETQSGGLAVLRAAYQMGQYSQEAPASQEQDSD